MESVTSATSGVRKLSAGQLKGSARGASICAFFGSAWMLWAVAFSGNPTTSRFLAVSVPAVGLVVSTLARARATRRLPSSSADLERSKAYQRSFRLVVGIEWGLSSIAVFALARIGRFDLIPQVLGVIIGLHFLPLARIFRAPIYYWTASLLVVSEISSLLIPRGYDRNIFSCAAVGIILWATSIAILYRTSAAVSEQLQSNLVI
jgi:hypothetical protein